jgi:hypothetical protein
MELAISAPLTKKRLTALQVSNASPCDAETTTRKRELTFHLHVSSIIFHFIINLKNKKQKQKKKDKRLKIKDVCWLVYTSQ